MEAVCDMLELLVQDGTIANYAIGGATAAGFHGEPLATRDVDVFVYLEGQAGSVFLCLEPLYRRLAALGFTEFDEEGIVIAGFPIQFLAPNVGLELEAVEQAMGIEWDGHRTRVMTPEHLAVIALATGCPKDRARVVYLTHLPQFNRETISTILERHGLVERWHQWARALELPRD